MELVRRARAWKREYARQSALEASARILGWSAAGVSLALWLDEALSLPQTARWALLIGGLAALLAAVYALLVRPWLRFDWGFVLDAAAGEFPELKDFLRPAWELHRGAPSPFTSEELKAAHLQRTERLLQGLPRRRVFSWRPSRLARRGALAALFGGFSLPWLGGGAPWERVLAPWRDVPLERFVSVSPGDSVVDWGSAVVITARWQPFSPVARGRGELKLWLKGPGGWRQRAWDRLELNAGQYVAEELTYPLEYRLSWKDLRSRAYRVTPEPVPKLESLRMIIKGLDQSEVVPLSAGEPISVMRGSWITLTGRPNIPLGKASLKVSSLPVPLAMKALRSGDYEAILQVSEDATLSIELESADGRRDPQPPLYALKALPDEPPAIELLSPLRPLQASPADTIPIAYLAKDDGGLTRISLLLRPAGQPEREVPLQRFARHSREFLGDYPWSLKGLAPGRVEFQLQAFDNARAPQSGLSQKGLVEIVDFESGHAKMESLWRRSEEQFKSLAARQEKVEALVSGPNPGELEAELGPWGESWKKAAEDFSELSRSMEGDAYSNPGVAQQSSALSEELSAAAARDVPFAKKSSRSGDKEDALKAHKRLSGLVRKTRRLLSEGGKLQSLQDFYLEAGRMSQAGSDIETALNSMSGSSVNAEALERLQSALSSLQKSLESLQKAISALPKAEPNSPEDRSRRAYGVPLNSAREAAGALERALAAGDYAAAARIARELSQRLAAIEGALGAAASEAAGSGMAGEASERLEKASALWSEALEGQTRVVEAASRLEERRLSRVLDAQKELLLELAREQGVLVSSAAALGPAFPEDALAAMKQVLTEFQSGRVVNAAAWLRSLSARLRMASGRPPNQAASRERFASSQDEILRRLEQGPPPPPTVSDSDSAAAARGQGEVRGVTRRLQNELESINAEVGTLPAGVVEGVEGAQAEQGQAEQALGRGDSNRGLSHASNALSLLEQGQKALAAAASNPKDIGVGMRQPFSRPGTGVRALGGLGAQMGFVPLPSAQDYRPPREIREELEKSLREKRPESYDRIIKEYFKRLAQ